MIKVVVLMFKSEYCVYIGAIWCLGIQRNGVLWLAEYTTLDHLTVEILWSQCLLKELQVEQKEKIVILVWQFVGNFSSN